LTPVSPAHREVGNVLFDRFPDEEQLPATKGPDVVDSLQEDAVLQPIPDGACVVMDKAGKLFSGKVRPAHRRAPLLTKVIKEIAEATGLNRMTLSKMANHHGANVQTDVLDKLCAYFGCRVEDLVEHVADDVPERPGISP